MKFNEGAYMNELYMSEDGAHNWVNTNLVEGMVTNLAFSSGEDLLYIGTARHGLLKQKLAE